LESGTLTYKVFKEQEAPEQIRTVHAFYETEYADIFLTSREAKTFFNSLIFDEECNSFIKLKVLKAVLWYCNNEWLTPEYAYDLYLDIKDENPFILTQKLKGLFLLGAEKESTQKAFNSLKDHQDGEVASEAYYNSGMATFFMNGVSRNIEFTIQSLNLALKQFESAIEIVENRTDALIFRKLTQLLIDIITNKEKDNLDDIASISSDLQKYQLAKLDNQLPLVDLEVFDCLVSLDKASQVLSKVDNWFDYRTELTKVNKYLFEILSINSTQDFFPLTIITNWKEKVNKNVFTPFLKLSLQAKIAAISSLRKSLSESDSDLKYFLDKVTQETDKKKDDANVELNSVALKRLFPSLPLNRLKEVVKSKDVTQSTINFLMKLVIEESNQMFSDTTSSIEKEILFELRNEINERISIAKEHRLNFYQVLTSIIRYVAVGYQRSDGAFKVLYNQPDASEDDFQDSLLLFLKTAGNHYKFDAEKRQFADGGRIDIVFSEGGQTTIPIEVKKTKKDFDRKTIYDNFLPQAQTYVTPYNQIGIFVLFDNRDKKNIPPNSGIKNLFYVDSIPSNIEAFNNYPDLVVNVIIPANKISPSSKSKYG